MLLGCAQDAVSNLLWLGGHPRFDVIDVAACTVYSSSAPAPLAADAGHALVMHIQPGGHLVHRPQRFDATVPLHHFPQFATTGTERCSECE